MTEITKDFIMRERHTFLGVLCGAAASTALVKNDGDEDTFSFFAKLVEIFAAAAVAHYAFTAKDKGARIRFCLGLAFSGICRYRAIKRNR